MARWRVKQITIDAVTWTDIVVPAGVPARSISLYNSDSSDIKIRSASGDATTEKTLVAGAQEVFPHFTPRPSGGDWKDSLFLPGDVICSVQAISGVGPIVLTVFG